MNVEAKVAEKRRRAKQEEKRRKKELRRQAKRAGVAGKDELDVRGNLTNAKH